MAFQENTSRILMLRDWQIQPAARLLEILRTGNAVDMSETGCHAAGTLILMADGNLKPVEHVQVGDTIQGWQGEPQFVTALSAGKGPMARIVPVKGASWTVNLDHVLTLQYTTMRAECGYGKFSGQIIDLKVSDFIKLPKAHKHVLKLFRRGVDTWPEKAVAFDPYFLGLMLGDGHISQRKISLSKPGDFIVSALKTELDKVPGESKMRTEWRGPGNPSHNVSGSAFQVWRKEFERLGLLGRKSGDKFIPFHYKTGSVTQRQQILCGLLDTDGAQANSGFDFISKSNVLAEDVAFVARSLGFAAYVKPSEKYCQTGGGGIYFRVSLSGDFSELPFQRHAPAPRKQIKSVLRTGFKVELMPVDNFYGFSLTGDGRFLLGDFMVTHNTGKTAVSAYVISQLKLPTLVIAPKISLTSWRRMLEHFGTSASIINWEALTMGKTPYGAFDKPIERGQFLFVCANCQRKYKSEETPDRCYATGNGIHCFNRKSVKQKRGRWTWAPQLRFVVADEGQRAGGIKSLNAELIIAARRQNIRTLGLSATLATSPLGLRAWGYALDLFPNPDAAFYSWSRRHGCGRIPALPGWRWLAGAERQREIMARISDEILPARGVRLTTNSIPNFPTRVVNVALFDAEKYETVDKLYSEMAAPPIVQQLRARMRLELFKLSIAVELCADARAKGQAVAIFCSFKATIAELRKRLNCDCFIDGSQSAEERQRCIDDFQSDRQQVILVNSKAGGVACSLHDLCGRPRLGIVFPSFSAVEYLQVLGRLHRDGALSPAMYKVVLVAGTVEEQIKTALDKKLDNLAALNDFDLIPNER